MRLAEIRDLDGPNLFLLEPAIKIELVLDDPSELRTLIERLGGEPTRPDELAALHVAAASILHRFDPGVRTAARWLETRGHLVFAFGWSHRRAALAIADLIVQRALGEEIAGQVEAIRGLRETIEPEDAPLMVRDADRSIPIVGITGTNGKTTTTRLLAHLLMSAGRHVGWSSSSGVYIDGSEVLSGDYSGPSGARRVLADPAVEVAVLETARGGILLRGIASEHNDVSVITNVSADHLGLQGIRTLEGLAEVKAIVARVTKPDGTAVLNGDDPLVLSSTQGIAASKLLFGQHRDSAAIAAHLAAGERAIVRERDRLVLASRDGDEMIAPLAEMPLTFGGRAAHMVENAMAASGAAVALGLDIATIRSGLATFRNSAEQNLGRLNVFDLRGATVVLDYAHNEAGTEHLIRFARSFLRDGGRLTMVIGTAGDRTDRTLHEIGRLAAEGADRIVIKASARYLRGRDRGELIALYQRGIRAAGKADAPVTPSELDGVRLAIEGLKPGDVVALMCQEQMTEITAELLAAGAVAV